MLNLENNTNLRVAARRLEITELSEEVIKQFEHYRSDPNFWVGRSTSLGVIAGQVFFNKGASASVAFRAGMTVAKAYHAILHSNKGENILALVGENIVGKFPPHCIIDMSKLIAKYISVRTAEHTRPNVANVVLNKVKR